MDAILVSLRLLFSFSFFFFFSLFPLPQFAFPRSSVRAAFTHRTKSDSGFARARIKRFPGRSYEGISFIHLFNNIYLYLLLFSWTTQRAETESNPIQ